MNSLRIAWILLHINLRLIPFTTWFLVLIFGFNFFIMSHVTLNGEISDIGNFFDALPLIFCVFFGMQFFSSGVRYPGAPSSCLMPAGEFLLVRPVSRRAAYVSRIFLYFCVVLSLPLIKMGMALPQPDMLISLYHRRNQSTDASDMLALYHKQFPESRVVRLPKATRETLLIPFGSVLICCWQTWVVILFALALQTSTLLALRTRMQMFISMALGIGPILLLALIPFGDQTAVMRMSFFLFVHHWVSITFLTFGIFVCVQLMALKRINELEVI